MEYKTNLSLLMALFQLPGSEMGRMIGVDKTLISRWGSGSRRLMPKRRWATLIADTFLSLDAEHEVQMLPALMSDAYRIGLLQGEELRAQLLSWLCQKGQPQPPEIERRRTLFAAFASFRDKAQAGMPTSWNEVVTAEDDTAIAGKTLGLPQARATLLALADYMGTLTEPVHSTFVCPEGIGMVTRDTKYGLQLLGKMVPLLQRGSTLDVVLRTEFSLSDVSAMAGPWLVAHLKGYVRSWYYDDFDTVENDRILVSGGKHFAVRISGEKYESVVYTDEANVSELGEICAQYLGKSKMRFHYELFQKPENYLKKAIPPENERVFVFQRLPHFLIGGKGLPERLFMEEKMAGRMLDQFEPLFQSPEALPDSTKLYHVMSMEAIEDALDQPRHLSASLSDMAGSRIYMLTQTLVDQLSLMQKQMEENPNYHVALVRDEVLADIGMEIGSWGTKFAIGWIPGGRSTATTDATNSAALHGYCQMVWDEIPATQKGNAAAKRQFAKLLNRAQKMGYCVVK